MKPDASRVSDFWARIVLDDPVEESQKKLVQDLLMDDIDFQDDALEDQKLHRMLGSIARIDQTRESFVSSTVKACEAATASDSTPATNPARRPQPSATPASGTQGIRLEVPRNQSRLRNPKVIGTVASFCIVCLLAAIYLGPWSSSGEDDSRSTASKRPLTPQSVPEGQRNRQETGIPEAGPNGPAGSGVVVAPVDQPPDFGQQPGADRLNPQVVDGKTLATLTSSADATWTGPNPGPEITAGLLELESGWAVLETTGGSKIKFWGPARLELVDAIQLTVERGRISASVSKNDVGLRVNTPSARVIDLGTEFEVTVDGEGGTDVNLLGGEVVVIPWQNERTGRRWRLESESFRRATVHGPLDAAHSPLISSVTGPGGFEGEIELAEQSIPFSSENRFDRMCETLEKRILEAPDQAIADWNALAEAFDAASGEVAINGNEVPFNGLDTVMRMEDSLNEPPGLNQFPGQGVGGFRGTIVINGERHSFESKEEYEKLREELLGPLRQFGIGRDGFGARQGPKLDKDVNPFLPKN